MSTERSLPRLIVLVTHPIPYFVSLYRRLAASGRVELVVLYMTDAGAHAYHDPGFGHSVKWDEDLLQGYHYEVLRPGLTTVPKGFRATAVRGLTSVLDAKSPDSILIYGYTRSFNWAAWRWARRHNRSLLYCSDSEPLRARALWVRIAKQMILRRFFRGVGVFLTAGDRNERYLAQHGADSRRFLRCPLPIDVESLKRSAFSADARDRTRTQLGLGPRTFVALQCGKLSPIKRPLDLATAVLRLRQRGHDVAGLFVGSGVLSREIERRADRSAHGKALILTGFVPPASLAPYYASAEALAIPSEQEAHPMVAAEAAACGLPLVVSDRVGCIGPTDVARHAENAIVFKCGDVDALSAALESLVMQPTKRAQMGAASARLAAAQDVSVAAEAILRAVSRRAGLPDEASGH